MYVNDLTLENDEYRYIREHTIIILIRLGSITQELLLPRDFFLFSHSAYIKHSST